MTASQNKEATRNLHWPNLTCGNVSYPFARLLTPPDINVHGYTDEYGNRHVNTTAVKYGGQIRLTRYAKTLRVNAFHKRKTYKKATVTQRRANNVNRAKRQVYRLVMCNFKQSPIRTYQNPVWATFTYPDSDYAKLVNRKSHIKDLEAYFRLLRQKYGKGIRYLAVMELTKKQNVHWHVMIFNMPKYESIKDLAQLWIDYNAGQGRECSHGGQELERIPWGYRNARSTAEDLAGYLSKYMAKTFELFGDYLDFSHSKLYLPSQGLEQPVTVSTLADLKELLVTAVLQNYFITYQSGDLEVPYVGTIQIQTLEPQT